MNKVVLTKGEARKIILHAAGLSRHAQFGRGKEAVQKLIEHLGFVQIDTNYVVERAHHHAIASRVPDYRLEWVDDLQAEGRIFEFWTFATGYIPMRDFRFSLPIKQSFLSGRKPLTQAESNLMRKVLDRISREGPLMARDFEYDRVKKSSGWWDWRPSKVALERLHLEGRLMTTRKKSFEKVYDLPGNILPPGVDMSTPTLQEYDRHVVRRALKAMGIAYAKEIVFSSRFVKSNVKAELVKMVEEGEVCRAEITGLKGSPLYMLPAYMDRKVTLAGDTFILSPFDILNVFRHRMRDFFDFDYQVECFVPKAKRKFGYFSLPILVGDKFIARMDAKADRKKRTLIVHNLHFEDLSLTGRMTAGVAEALANFVKFNQCDKVVFEKSNQRSVVKEIQKGM